MKHFIAKLGAAWTACNNETMVCVSASNPTAARRLLADQGLQGELHEVSAVTFEEMGQMLPRLQALDMHELTSESEPHERVRTMARRLCDALAKRNVKVAYGTLLHAVASSLGCNDWFVLQAQPRAAFRKAKLSVAPREAASLAFRTRMHAVWLAEGDAALAAALLNTTESSLLQSMDAMEADAAFCGRPTNWHPQCSLASDEDITLFQHRIRVEVETRVLSDGFRHHQVWGYADDRAVLGMSNGVGRQWTVGSCSTLPMRDLDSARVQLACMREVMRTALELQDEHLKSHPPVLEVTCG